MPDQCGKRYISPKSSPAKAPVDTVRRQQMVRPLPACEKTSSEFIIIRHGHSLRGSPHLRVS